MVLNNYFKTYYFTFIYYTITIMSALGLIIQSSTTTDINIDPYLLATTDLDNYGTKK